MNNEKYYNKAMEVIDSDNDKALSILEKGASKGELKSIEKLIDINVNKYINYSFNREQLECSEISKKDLPLIYELFSKNKAIAPNYYTGRYDEKGNYIGDAYYENIVKYLEMACEIDKKYTYLLGCLYTCFAYSWKDVDCVYYDEDDKEIHFISNNAHADYKYIENISNGDENKLDSILNEEYLLKAFDLFKSNLSDKRNMEMYLGLIFCYWDDYFESKFTNGKYETIINLIEKDKDFTSDYLRLPMKVYFLNKNFDKAKDIANKIIQKEKGNSIKSDDFKAANYVLFATKTIEEKLDLSNIDLNNYDEIVKYIVLSGNFIYDKLAYLKNDTGLVFTILFLYDLKEKIDEESYGQENEYKQIKEHKLSSKLEDEKHILDIYEKTDICNLYEDLLWKFYDLKFIITNNQEYDKKSIDAKYKVDHNVNQNLEALIYSDNEDDIEKAILYSRNKKMVFSEFKDDTENEVHRSYEDIKNNDNFFENHSIYSSIYDIFYEKTLLKALYECKYNYQNNKLLEEILYSGLFMGCESKELIPCNFDGEPEEMTKNVLDKFDFNKINVVEHNYLEKLNNDYKADREKYKAYIIGDITDASLFTNLLIKKYKESDNEPLINIIKKAIEDKVIDKDSKDIKALIDEKDFDLDKVKERNDFKNGEIKYYYLTEDNLYEKTVINYKIIDEVFNCLFTINKENNNLPKLKEKLFGIKNRIFVDKYIESINKELGIFDRIDANLKENLEITKEIDDNVGFIISLFDNVFIDEIAGIKKKIDDSNKTEEDINEICDKIAEKFEEKIKKLDEQKSDEANQAKAQEIEAVYQAKAQEVKNAFVDVYDHEYEMLEEDSKKMLISAYLAFDCLEKYGDKADYSGPCIAISKVVELELKKRFYYQYIEYKKANNIMDDGCDNYEHINTGKEKEVGNAENRHFVIETPHIIKEEKEFTLGSIAYLTGFTGRNANSKFKEYIESQNILKEEIDPVIALREIGDGCVKITNKYRNVSAHCKPVKKGLAKKCKEYIVESTKFLASTLHKFRNL